MARSDDRYTEAKKSPRDVTIELGRQAELLASPLTSPLLSRPRVAGSKKYPIPSLNDHKITPDGSDCDSYHKRTSDDNTFCSMDDSIKKKYKEYQDILLHDGKSFLDSLKNRKDSSEIVAWRSNNTTITIEYYTIQIMARHKKLRCSKTNKCLRTSQDPPPP